MITQPKIVVRGEVDDAPAVVAADRPLLVVQHAELEVGARLLQRVHLRGQMGELLPLGGGGLRGRDGWGGDGGHREIVILFSLSGSGDPTSQNRDVGHPVRVAENAVPEHLREL